MSANLWSAENVTPAENPEDGIYACSGTRGVRTNVSLDRMASNQTFHCGFSVNPGKDDKFNMTLCYRDAAGSVNWAFGTDTSAPAGKWTRVSHDVVVPSGMTVYQMVICNNNNASGSSGWKVMNPTLSLGSPVCLASSAHTPYATQDHVSTIYATKASLKVTDDSVKAEVSARAQTDRNVADLSSRLTQTANSLTTEISDRRSAITTVTGLANAAQSTANTAKSNASAAQATADNAAKQANLYTIGNGDAGAVPKWIHLGTLTSAGDASSATIAVAFGDGYDGYARQNSALTITIKDGYQPAASATKACGVTAMRENCDNALVDVLAQSATVYDVWVYAPWDYSQGCYSVSGRYASWQHSGATQKAEPATSATQVRQDVAYRLADATKAQTMATENQSSIKQLSTSITAEVTARTKTDRMVSEVSSRLTQTASGLSASISKLSETDKKVNAWFDFEADASGNPQLTMGSSSSPVVGTYTNTGLAYKSRDGATIMELDASRSATISDHIEAQDMKLGKWKWVQTQGGTHLTLVWEG